MNPDQQPQRQPEASPAADPFAGVALPAGFADREEFIKAVETKVAEWVATFDNPDEPIIGGGEAISPRKMLQDIMDRNEDGMYSLKAFAQHCESKEDLMDRPPR